MKADRMVNLNRIMQTFHKFIPKINALSHGKITVRKLLSKILNIANVSLSLLYICNLLISFFFVKDTGYFNTAILPIGIIACFQFNLCIKYALLVNDNEVIQINKLLFTIVLIMFCVPLSCIWHNQLFMLVSLLSVKGYEYKDVFVSSIRQRDERFNMKNIMNAGTELLYKGWNNCEWLNSLKEEDVALLKKRANEASSNSYEQFKSIYNPKYSLAQNKVTYKLIRSEAVRVWCYNRVNQPLKRNRVIKDLYDHTDPNDV